MTYFRPKNRFFGNKTGFHSVSRPETVINRFSGQKYVNQVRSSGSGVACMIFPKQPLLYKVSD